jgi:Family of unknown function (DUF6580)
MNKNFVNPKFLALTIMILAASLTRLIPHYPNFTAIGAMALFGGAYFSKKSLAFVVPFAAMFLTDLILGFHATMWSVYLSFGLIVIIGMLMINKVKLFNVFLASITASVLFFVVTNFAMWTVGGIYSSDYKGLIECYTAAIPFFSYTLLGDLFYVGLMFGVFEIAKAKFPQLAKA